MLIATEVHRVCVCMCGCVGHAEVSEGKAISNFPYGESFATAVVAVVIVKRVIEPFLVVLFFVVFELS